MFLPAVTPRHWPELEQRGCSVVAPSLCCQRKQHWACLCPWQGFGTRSCIAYPDIQLSPQSSLRYPIFRNQRPLKCTVFPESLIKIWCPNAFFILISPQFLLLIPPPSSMRHVSLSSVVSRSPKGICCSSQLPGELEMQWCLHWRPALLLPRHSCPLPARRLRAASRQEWRRSGLAEMLLCVFSSCNSLSKQEA